MLYIFYHSFIDTISIQPMNFTIMFIFLCKQLNGQKEASGNFGLKTFFDGKFVLEVIF